MWFITFHIGNKFTTRSDCHYLNKTNTEKDIHYHAFQRHASWVFSILRENPKIGLVTSGLVVLKEWSGVVFPLPSLVYTHIGEPQSGLLHPLPHKNNGLWINHSSFNIPWYIQHFGSFWFMISKGHLQVFFLASYLPEIHFYTLPGMVDPVNLWNFKLNGNCHNNNRENLQTRFFLKFDSHKSYCTDASAWISNTQWIHNWCYSCFHRQ